MNQQFRNGTFDAMFTGARELATAKSLPEITKIQLDFATKFAAQATEQTKEFADLSSAPPSTFSRRHRPLRKVSNRSPQ